MVFLWLDSLVHLRLEAMRVNPIACCKVLSVENYLPSKWQKKYNILELEPVFYLPVKSNLRAWSIRQHFLLILSYSVIMNGFLKKEKYMPEFPSIWECTIKTKCDMAPLDYVCLKHFLYGILSGHKRSRIVIPFSKAWLYRQISGSQTLAC